ncbi:MAG: preprotein translocase subunit YajC [Gemmatimonadetes bacterium]|nr:preprotein translocase subunit YajC [Gemmatimonadota bacterium]
MNLPVLTTPLPLPAAPGEGTSGLLRLLLQVTAFLAIFYFLLIRPNQKREKARRQSIEALKPGDEIVTNGGIIGSVVHIDDGRLTVRTGDSTRITVDQARVAAVLDVK